jgi:MFS superfamily sulfate permease-like transporter
VGSVLLISVFYFTDYQLAGFIPKPAFSSLLVLSFIDVINTWFIRSYYKTEEKLEWLVVPLIVILTFVVGLLQAVLLGLSLSAILFIASFCKFMFSTQLRCCLSFNQC